MFEQENPDEFLREIALQCPGTVDDPSLNMIHPHELQYPMRLILSEIIKTDNLSGGTDVRDWNKYDSLTQYSLQDAVQSMMEIRRILLSQEDGLFSSIKENPQQQTREMFHGSSDKDTPNLDTEEQKQMYIRFLALNNLINNWDYVYGAVCN